MTHRAVYRFAPKKAFEAIHYMVSSSQPIDLHTILKACYFADKSHLNEHHKPIFGATYRAMRFGPVPLEIYEMVKGESLWLWECGRDRMPWSLHGYRVSLDENENSDLGEFSETEKEHLINGLRQSASMSFTDRTAATHGPDWQKANGGIIAYEDMLDENMPGRDQIVEYMRETARHVRL